MERTLYTNVNGKTSKSKKTSKKNLKTNDEQETEDFKNDLPTKFHLCELSQDNEEKCLHERRKKETFMFYCFNVNAVSVDDFHFISGSFGDKAI